MTRVAIYLRCSTLDQNVEAQRDQLTVWAENAGHEIVTVYSDEGVSGMKKREERPEFNRMMTDAARREFDMIAVWTMCRFGRSLSQVTAAMDELRGLEIAIFAFKQGLDSTTTQGRMMMQLFGMFAEMENELRRERCESGRARNRKLGKPNGKSVDRSYLARIKDDEIAGLIRAGKSITFIKSRLGCGDSRIRRVEREILALET